MDKDIDLYEKERLIAEGVDIVSSDALPTNLEESSELESGPDQSLEKAQMITALADAIEQLPERARIVLALYYQEEMNLKEIGAILEVSESRVSQIISETAGKLRALMSLLATESKAAQESVLNAFRDRTLTPYCRCSYGPIQRHETNQRAAES